MEIPHRPRKIFKEIVIFLKACGTPTGEREIPWGSLRWRHNGCDSVSYHQPHHCLLNRLFRRRWKKTSKLRVTGLCAGNSPGSVNSPYKWPVTRKMFPFDDVIMGLEHVDGLTQDCSISSALAMEILQYCIKPPMCWSSRCLQTICGSDLTDLTDITAWTSNNTEGFM